MLCGSHEKNFFSGGKLIFGFLFLQAWTPEAGSSKYGQKACNFFKLEANNFTKTLNNNDIGIF